eukprot:scaffold2455_cov387-Prasinococcus_capsulatus_cf.AAC.7
MDVLDRLPPAGACVAGVALGAGLADVSGPPGSGNAPPIRSALDEAVGKGVGPMPVVDSKPNVSDNAATSDTRTGGDTNSNRHASAVPCTVSEGSTGANDDTNTAANNANNNSSSDGGSPDGSDTNESARNKGDANEASQIRSAVDEAPASSTGAVTAANGVHVKNSSSSLTAIPKCTVATTPVCKLPAPAQAPAGASHISGVAPSTSAHDAKSALPSAAATQAAAPAATAALPVPTKAAPAKAAASGGGSRPKTTVTASAGTFEAFWAPGRVWRRAQSRACYSIALAPVQHLYIERVGASDCRALSLP